jgi:hypothetical protein
MTPTMILAELDSLGCYLKVLSIDPPSLRLFDFAERTTPELRCAIATNKAALCELLCQQLPGLYRKLSKRHS